MSGAVRVAVVSKSDEASAVRVLRSWIEDLGAAQGPLVFHPEGSLHREPDGTAYFVGHDGSWLRPSEVPVA